MIEQQSPMSCCASKTHPCGSAGVLPQAIRLLGSGSTAGAERHVQVAADAPAPSWQQLMQNALPPPASAVVISPTASSPGPGPATLTRVYVRTLDGSLVAIDAGPCDTAGDLQRRLHARTGVRFGSGAGRASLYHSGARRRLRPNEPLAGLGLSPVGAPLQVMGRLCGGTPGGGGSGLARPNSACPAFFSRPVQLARKQAREEEERQRRAYELTPGASKFVPTSCLPRMEGTNAGQCGISLRLLRRFREQVVAFQPSQQQLREAEQAAAASKTGIPGLWPMRPDGALTTKQVVDWIIRPATAAKKVRYTAVLAEEVGVGEEDVGVADYFISHAWGCSFLETIDMALGHLSAAPETTKIWLDMFAINQHNPSADLDQFKVAIQGAVATLVCLCDAVTGAQTETAVALTRIWCLHEFDCTLNSGDEKLLLLHPGYSQARLAEVFAAVDAANAKAYDARDTDFIHAHIRDNHGSLDAFSAKLKLRLLLEPLSYSVDLRRLTQRAADTQWSWGPVQAWLKSPSRALCVSSGAGEGKSSISAAMCDPGSGAFRERIAAFHFLKYSDQRRLDPLRIVKSLAYQLALRLPEVAAHILLLDAAAIASVTDLEHAFELLLLGPLKALHAARPQQEVVILMDALDEADPLWTQLSTATAHSLHAAESSAGADDTHERSNAKPRVVCPIVRGNRALTLASTLLPSLPPSVRFIFTTRPDAAAHQVLPCLQHTFSQGCVVVEPPALRTASTSPATACGNSSSNIKQGVMVYHALRDALPPAVAGGEPQGAAEWRPSLADVYRLYGKAFDAARGAYDAELVAVLSAFQEPPSQAMLHAMGFKSDALQSLPGGGGAALFFMDEHHVYIVHKSLGDWLADPALSGPHAPRVSRGHELIGLHLASGWASGRRSSPEYLLRYAAAHLATAAQAGSDIASAALDGLLGDPGYLSAVVKCRHGGALVEALGGLDVGHRRSRVQHDAFRWLRASLHTLEAGPGTIAALRHTALSVAPLGSALREVASSWPMEAGSWATHMVLPGAAAWGSCEAVLQGHTGPVTSVAWSPDGKQLASASADNTLRVWDAATGNQLAQLQGHTGTVTSVAWSPDGKQLASASDDNTLRVWDAATGNQLAQLQGHTGWVNSVAWSPDGKQLASASRDKTLRVWDAATGNQLAQLQGHTDWVTSVAWSPDGKQLASASRDKTLRVWDAATGNQLAQLQGHTNTVRSVAWSPDGKQLASASADKTLRVWDAATGNQLAQLRGHTSTVRSVAWSPDGKQLASASDDKTLRVWDAATGNQLAQLQGHTNTVNSVAWSPIGKQLASASDDKTLRVWDAATGNQLAQLQGHTNWVTSVAWSPDGKQLASASWDKTLRVWDAATGNQLAQLQGHTGTVRSVAWSPDGKQLASASEDKTLHLTGKRAEGQVQGAARFS